MLKIIRSLFASMKSKFGKPKKFFHIQEPNISVNERHRRFQAAYNVRRGRPPAMKHPFINNTRQDIARVVFDPFNEALLELGFERASHKLWVRRDLAPICHISSLERYGSTGWGIAANFGLSLDFVPHVAAGTVKWHRTAKSARYDLRVNTKSRWLGVTTFENLATIQEEVDFMMPRALKMACGFWEQAKSIEEVANRFDWSEGRFLRSWKHKLPYSAFIKPSPADAFLAAKLGCHSKAVRLLDEWLETERITQKYEINPEVPSKLQKLLRECTP